jgi:hypothetical protein
MEQVEPNWSKEELKAYLVLYCINTDFSITNRNLDANIFNISKNRSNDLQKEFHKDNDYKSIQKICTAIEKNNYSSDLLNSLFLEIKELIIQSGRKYNYLMKSLFIGLERNILIAA